VHQQKREDERQRQTMTSFIALDDAITSLPAMYSPSPLESLNFALVLLGRGPGSERAEVASSSSTRVCLS